MKELHINLAGFGVPAPTQKPLGNRDKNIEGKAPRAMPATQATQHQENKNMPNDQEQTQHHTKPIPSVPLSEPVKVPANEKAKQFGTTALVATRDNAAIPVVWGFFAACGALLAYKGGKKIGWL